MSNPRVPYEYFHDRAGLAPLEGASILVHVVVNVEHWPFDEPMPRTVLTPPHGKESLPDVPNFAWAEYGMRCGLPRMVRALRSRSLPASTSCNASVLDVYPRAAQAMLEAGWEFIGHGMHQRSLHTAVSEAETITAALDKLGAFTGRRPTGWLSPGLRETGQTLEHLRAAGVEHVFDWCLDDLPCWMSTASGPLLSLPYNLELNDSVICAVEKQPSSEFLTRASRTLKLFEREVQADRQPRVLALGLHPHLMGVPHRFGDLEALLDMLMASPLVRFVTGSDIARWYGQQVPAPVTAPGLQQEAA
ncbi:polysaccharide deacetylase family protein [Azohydromonas australica]|uniref:polysaccharide deacetylase family protein n=1 Tax=Azohydromonas australica TaxID=364039 RepID=UPI00040A0C0D|nr:polysaccharide deacetylase family protein [Azohydromonas australica]